MPATPWATSDTLGPWNGEFLSIVVPSPSWPWLFLPTAHRVPSDLTKRLWKLTLAEAVIGNGLETKEKQDAAIAARIKDFEDLGPAEVARKKTPNSLSPNADPAAIQAAIAFASKVKVAGHLKLAAALIRCNIFDFVTPLACPSMIIAGSDDRSAPPEFVKKIADAYPGINHQTIDGIGHQIAFEKPEQFIRLLNEHLGAAS